MFAFIPLLLSLFVVIVVTGILSSLVQFWHLPKSIDIPRDPSQSSEFLQSSVSRTLSYLTSWTSFRVSLANGYEEYSKRGKAFMVPLASLAPQVIVPPEHIVWLLNQPKTIVSQREALFEDTAFKYLFPSFDFESDAASGMARRQLAHNQLGRLQKDIFEELRSRVDENMGVEEGVWRTINLYSAFDDIFSKTGYRIYFGAELISDKRFIANLRRLSKWTTLGVVLIGQLTPLILRKPLGSILRIPISYYTRKFMQSWLPLLLDCQKNMRSEKFEDAIQKSNAPTMTTWFAEIISKPIPGGESMESALLNVITLIIGSSDVKVAACLGLFINTLTIPAAVSYLPELRSEACRTLSTDSAYNTSEPFAEMPLMEAFMRESMRWSPLKANMPSRIVVAEQGVMLPDGTHVPKNTVLASPSECVSRDERFYDEPHVFNPYRFLERNPIDGGWVLKPGCHVTSASDTFLFFGLGKSVCPGRFFVARLMMTFMAYVVTHYEFEVVGEAGGGHHVGYVNVPQVLMKARFRRRMQTE
ncbi:cytochrome P450 [Amniculicola lignicola CBS 123094]|uniref:Cytochrome P450 n=1 Tax=Amniculicola lignicola CBS 123094 TaxID=1392246 RepID=A0A6A5VW63_9PLEO|nr:cytochrome P450 [Amniculicola lignicola CBS 123094]